MRFSNLSLGLLGFVVLVQSTPVTLLSLENREVDTLPCINDGDPTGSGALTCHGQSEPDIDARRITLKSDSVLL